MEIACRGPFRFDVLRRVATFRDGVDVMKTNASGPADQIACDLLSLFFVVRGGASADPGSLDLAAQRIEARGNPVIVTAPSRNLNARGPRIEYNLLSESIALDGAQEGGQGEVFLQQGPNQIHARSLNYQPAGRDRLGCYRPRAGQVLRPKRPLGRPTTRKRFGEANSACCRTARSTSPRCPAARI